MSSFAAKLRLDSLLARAYSRAQSGNRLRQHRFFRIQFLVMFKPPPANRGARLFADAAPEPNAPTSATAALPSEYRRWLARKSRPSFLWSRDSRSPRPSRRETKEYIGRSTNNVAEYYGLIAALDYAQQHGIARCAWRAIRSCWCARCAASTK